MKQNPYEPTPGSGQKTPTAQPRSLLRAAIAGSVWSVISAFPITGLLAMFFRFPVPFGDIEGGLAHVLPAIRALLFYGVVMGGFVVVAACGGIAGIAAQFAAQTGEKRRQLQRCLSIAVTFILLLVLATLDWFIGPW